MVSEVKKEILFWVVVGTLVFVALSGVGFFLASANQIGKTYVDRKVMETSHQYHQARKSELETYRAELDGVVARLRAEIPERERAALEAHKATLEARIRAAENR